MTFLLDRIDTSPIFSNEFTQDFTQWITILVDSLNENFSDIETGFNFLTAPNLAILTEAVTLTLGLPSFTVVDGTLYTDGEIVIGTGIPANTNILSIVGNVITLTNNATVNGSETLFFVPLQGSIGNGILLYDTTNNVYVGMISGALVKFTTTAYP